MQYTNKIISNKISQTHNKQSFKKGNIMINEAIIIGGSSGMGLASAKKLHAKDQQIESLLRQNEKLTSSLEDTKLDCLNEI